MTKIQKIMCWARPEEEIDEMIGNVKTQKDADDIYILLDSYMCDECIFQDGEVSYEVARRTFNYWLKKAKRIPMKPSKDIYSDVFFSGVIPSRM
jgi:hypothetical protein